MKPPQRWTIEGRSHAYGKSRDIGTPVLSFASETSYSSPASLWRSVSSSAEVREEAPGFSRRTQLRFLGLFGVLRVHGMRSSQSVAGLRYAQVEGMPPQPAVRLHQEFVRLLPVGRTSGFDKVVQKAEAHDHPAPRDVTRAALAATRGYDHDRAMLAATNIDLL